MTRPTAGPAEAQTGDTGNRWTFWGKLAVTVGLFGILFWRVDFSQFGHALRDSIGIWLVLAFLANSLLLIISTYKWDGLLQTVGISSSLWTLLQLYAIGFFASSFLPGSVGGDVIRWQMTGTHTGGRMRVAATIVAERATGVVALGLMGIAAVVAEPEFATPPVFFLLALATAGLLLGTILLRNRRLAVFVRWRLRRIPFYRFFRPLFRLQRTLRGFPRRPLAAAIGYSFLFYLSAGLTFYLIGRAFGADLGFVQAVGVQVLVCLLTLLPISLGGLGLGQVGDVFLLTVLGIAYSQALGISIVRLLIRYSYVLIGGVLFLRWETRQGPVEARTAPAPGGEQPTGPR